MNDIEILQILVSILTLLVTIIAIAIPLMIYYLQIKPSQKVLNKVKNIEEMVNLKVLEILEQKETMRINRAIEELNSSVEEAKNRAFQILNSNQDYEYSELQLFGIYKYLMSNTSIQHKMMLSEILASKRTKFADDFFQAVMKGKDHSGINLNATLKYFSNYNFRDNIPLIRYYIFNSANADDDNSVSTIKSNYFQVAIGLLNLSKENFIQLINDNELNAGLDIQIRKYVFDAINGYSQNIANLIDLTNTKLGTGLSK